MKPELSEVIMMNKEEYLELGVQDLRQWARDGWSVHHEDNLVCFVR